VGTANAGDHQHLIKKAVNAATDGYELSLATSGFAFFRLNQLTNGDTYRINATTAYPTNGTTWVHLAATYDGATMRLYVNGVQQASLAASITIATNNLGLGIGCAERRGIPLLGHHG
jgi:isocitrate lyase